jgi:hypothetical protein
LYTLRNIQEDWDYILIFPAEWNGKGIRIEVVYADHGDLAPEPCKLAVLLTPEWYLPDMPADICTRFSSAIRPIGINVKELFIVDYTNIQLFSSLLFKGAGRIGMSEMKTGENK